MGRNYKNIRPHNYYFRRVLHALSIEFWIYYRQLLVYKLNPTPEEAMNLEAEFKQLFSAQTNYRDLNKRNAQTYDNTIPFDRAGTPGNPLVQQLEKIGS